jgi:hypothetical protein
MTPPLTHYRRFFSLFVVVTVAFFLAGCATSRSALMVPVRPSPMHTLPAPPPARLRIPVIVALPELKDVEKEMARAAEEDWKKDVDAPLEKKLGTKIWWDPLDWEFKGNTLTAHMHVHYKTSAPQDAAAAQEAETLVQKLEKDAKVDVASVLRWTEDWHLEAPGFQEKAGEGPVTGEDEDKKAAHKGEKILRKGTSLFHEVLKAKGEFKEKVAEIWKRIQEPVKVGEDTWLQILPHSVGVGKSRLVAGVKPRLETFFEIVAEPNVSFGQKPDRFQKDLPPLKEVESGPGGFHAKTNLKISFKELNKLLADPRTGLIGKPLPGTGSGNITLQGIRLYGSGGQIVVEAQIDYQPVLNLASKPAQLTVYLLGTPHYHDDSQTIDFPDLDFDVKSSDFLVQMATFVDGGGMRDQLREKAVIPVGKDMDKLKELMVKMLNRPLGKFARLRTDVTSLRLEEAFVSDYGIESRVALDGDATVDVDW